MLILNTRMSSFVSLTLTLAPFLILFRPFDECPKVRDFHREIKLGPLEQGGRPEICQSSKTWPNVMRSLSLSVTGVQPALIENRRPQKLMWNGSWKCVVYVHTWVLYSLVLSLSLSFSNCARATTTPFSRFTSLLHPEPVCSVLVEAAKFFTMSIKSPLAPLASLSPPAASSLTPSSTFLSLQSLMHDWMQLIAPRGKEMECAKEEIDKDFSSVILREREGREWMREKFVNDCKGREPCEVFLESRFFVHCLRSITL